MLSSTLLSVLAVTITTCSASINVQLSETGWTCGSVPLTSDALGGWTWIKDASNVPYSCNGQTVSPSQIEATGRLQSGADSSGARININGYYSGLYCHVCIQSAYVSTGGPISRDEPCKLHQL